MTAPTCAQKPAGKTLCFGAETFLDLPFVDFTCFLAIINLYYITKTFFRKLFLTL